MPVPLSPRRFRLVLVKPSHFGYGVILWFVAAAIDAARTAKPMAD
ncbi:MAG TPA: hypothetical protein VFW75_05415 [Acetobacteraceae bacterium]|nr:hypothetical protein [Acetobacteraceae bacterium]